MGKKFDFEGVGKTYGMPWLHRLMKVEVNGRMGKITGTNGTNIMVKFDNDPYRRYSGNCHPHWETRYFDREGNVIADYRRKKEQKIHATR